MFPTFWRKTKSFQEVERESILQERLLFYKIHFTLGYFAMRAKYMKASTSQSSQRNFLIKSKK
ncbi:MAG: hypothetical protein A3C81_02515 [Candidatus Yanofskybacteria bacterium RIFCSPHIGHO2_02_FULL_46_19]|uniref:Uncharacterized protein n=1 Tax=Candidatus Yanofskybacteria bacterium RIFCSPHIGHO2_02_FULL_46_19 TaxID=1802684 RepID=A0A1F8FUB7_9BACT|nr:MAG: hypothetical protein A3C81_02515 [Candidatus Yanofskybacteria bacterium RIFCSPHIGHO2_02_FULL_46_19]